VLGPPWSPDFDKVIEHAHANLKRKFFELLEQYKGERTPEKLWELLEKAAKEVLTVQSIAADVSTLPYTIKVIAREPTDAPVVFKGKSYPGVAGGWPARALR
jgi:hypothetical protein